MPSEHGGWGFLLEPVVVGLIVAPSAAGLALAVAALGVFLARHPLHLALGDRLKGRTAPRTRPAALMAAAYGALAALGLGLAWRWAAGEAWLAPLLVGAAPLTLQLAYDVRNRGRELTPQLLGAAAPGSLATAMTMAAGEGAGAGLGLWALLALRGVASVLYVRARLRRDRGEPGETWSALAIHGLALVGVTVLAAARLASWLAVAAFAVLLARAGLGLRARDPLRPQTLGVRELAYGLGTALLIGLSYAWAP